MGTMATKDYDGKRVEELRKIIAAQQVGEGTSPEEAATVADEKTFSVKQEQALQDGKCDESDALENIIDRKVAQYCTWFENNAPVFVEKGCEYVGSVIGAFLGNPEKGKEIGRTIGKAFAPVVKEGAKMLTSFCKRAITRVKETLTGIGRTGIGIVKAVFG